MAFTARHTHRYDQPQGNDSELVEPRRILLPILIFFLEILRQSDTVWETAHPELRTVCPCTFVTSMVFLCVCFRSGVEQSMAIRETEGQRR